MADNFNPYHAWLGIPPAEQPADYYRLLGVSRFEADLDVISNAADARMVYVRTFQSSQRAPISQKILNELSAVKICLLDPQKKAAYDAQLRARMAQIMASKQQAPTAAQPGAPAAQRPLAQAKPLVAQPLPAKSAAGQPTFDPLDPLAINPHSAANQLPAVTAARGLAPAKPNAPNHAPKAARGKSNPPWLMPAIIGGGVGLTALLVVAAVVVMMSAGKRPIAKVSTDKKNPTMPAATATAPPTTVEPVANPSSATNTPNPSTAPPIYVPPATVPATTSPPVAIPPVTNPPAPAVIPSQPSATASNEPETVLATSDLLEVVPKSVFYRHWMGNNSTTPQGLNLSSPTNSASAGQVLFRVVNPDEYDLEAIFNRKTSEGGVGFGIVVGGKPCAVAIDGWSKNGFLSGLTLIDGRSPDQPDYPAKAYRGPLLTSGTDALVVTRVRKNSVTILCDGKEIFAWVGNPGSLSLGKDINFKQAFISVPRLATRR